jgi:hypothetical protein
MEPAMTKLKTLAAAAIAAVTLATALTARSEAQARPRFGTALGIGIAAGALIGMAAASSAYAGPAYVVEPGYRECRYVERYDRWGNIRMVKICDVVPY